MTRVNRLVGSSLFQRPKIPRAILAPGWMVRPYLTTSTGYARTRPCSGTGTAEISCRDGRIVVGFAGRLNRKRPSAEASFEIEQASVRATQQIKTGRNVTVRSLNEGDHETTLTLYFRQSDCETAHVSSSEKRATKSRSPIPIVTVMRLSSLAIGMPVRTGRTMRSGLSQDENDHK